MSYFQHIMQQQTYFLQKMGITVWQENIKPENAIIPRKNLASSLWIISNLSSSDKFKSASTTSNDILLGNIVKAMQISAGDWQGLNYPEALENLKIVGLVFPQWLWLMGLSEPQRLGLQAQLSQCAPELKLVTSCDIQLLAQSKSEKAMLWQQISKFLR